MSRSSVPERVTALALAAVCALGLAACTDDSPGLPSVGGATASPTAGSGTDFEAVAKAFYTCLRDAGVPDVEYGEDWEGRSTLVTFSESSDAIGIYPNGWVAAGGAVSEAQWNDFNEFMMGQLPPDGETYDEEGNLLIEYEAKLTIAGKDWSAEWAKCIADSGYDEQALYDGAPAGEVDPQWLEAQVEANNEWAACAREHGFPGIADSTVPASTSGDDYISPMVLLPASITEDQLRALLEDCPSFDAEQEKRNTELLDQAYEDNPDDWSLPDGYKATPSIGFDFPGLDGDWDAMPESMSPDQMATYERLVQLQTILWEAADAYYQEVYGDDIVVVEAEATG
jgi:hypothetical protein